MQVAHLFSPVEGKFHTSSQRLTPAFSEKRPIVKWRRLSPLYIVFALALCALAAAPALAQSYSPLYPPSSSNTVYIYCLDAFGNYYSGCLFTFATGPYNGYQHTHYSPGPPSSSVSPTSCTTNIFGYCLVSVNTTIVGQAEYLTIGSSSPGIASGVYNYAVGVTIYYVSDHGIWTLNGQKAIHGGTTAFNHWMTSNAANGIYNATVLYQASYPGLVLANDMSLPFGGVFDLSANWLTTPTGHVSHQFGFDSDIDGISGATPVSTFRAACTAKGATYTAIHTNGSIHCHWPN